MSSRDTPFDRLEQLFGQLSRQLEEAAREVDVDRLRSAGAGGSGIGIDLADRDDEFVVTADVPGFEKDEIDLRTRDGTLYIEATKEHAAEEGDETYLRRERRHRSLRERVRIPDAVDEDAIEARLTNGVLTVWLPKVEPSGAGGRRIDVE